MNCTDTNCHMLHHVIRGREGRAFKKVGGVGKKLRLIMPVRYGTRAQLFWLREGGLVGWGRKKQGFIGGDWCIDRRREQWFISFTFRHSDSD